MTGSSPRVRGKPPRGRRACLGRRLIPARAGKTRRRRRASQPRQAHPRACGENSPLFLNARLKCGSSPRVRGKRPSPRRSDDARRLIPARAGKTRMQMHEPQARPAHPRACGENLLTPDSDEARPGSSPRVRGKLAGHHARLESRRLIPARAGKTPGGARRSPCHWAHPRACGENGDGVDDPRGAGGSSPRVRGKRARPLFVALATGLIPARAGKTGRGRWSRSPRTAHPRACGENSVDHSRTRASKGSSPRVRGKPREEDPRRPRRGLIPARAGKT